MHVGHKLATSYSISRADRTPRRLEEVNEEKDLGVTKRPETRKVGKLLGRL